ncbi:sialidase [Clostridia bacterium]|nr:sialidase [Clostridia bacterium]
MKILKKSLAIICGLALTFTASVFPVPHETDITAAVTTATAANYEWQNVKIGGGGGFIAGIVYNQTEEGLVYARTDMGGVYRRDKITGDWISLLDWVSPTNWNLLGGESVATDPIEPNRVYIAAGTYTNSWTNMNGYILRSDDYGETWEKTEMPFKMGGNMPGRGMGERLVVDPNANNVLYFGARGMASKGEKDGSLWKSVDYGETWTEITNIPVSGSYVEDASYEYSADPQGVVWITPDKHSSTKGTACQTLYVGIADKTCPVIMTTDGGKTWKAATNQPTEVTIPKLNNETTLTVGIPHHGVLTDNGILYITYSDRAGPYQSDDGAVYKCDTATMTWTNITPYLSATYGWMTLPDGTSGQGYSYEYPNYFGFGGLAVDPQNPDTLMVASLQSWWPDNYIFRSNDGGVTWNNSGTWTSYPARDLNYTLDISAAPWLDWGMPVNAVNGGELADGENPNPKIGWMIEAMAIDPFNPNEMMYGTGATLYKTDNATAWDSYTYDYDVWPVVVTKPELMHIKSAANGIEETAVLDLIVPPVDGVKLISGLGDINGFVHKDVNAVQNMMSSLVMTSTTGLDYAELNPNIIVRVGNGDEDEYTPTKHIIAVSKDGGATWSEGPQPAYASVNFDGIPEGGSVAMSADGSSYVWSPSGNNPVVLVADGSIKATNLPNNAWVASDRVNSNIYYASSGGKLYKSTNGGLTFTENFNYGVNFGTSKIKAVPGEEGHVWLPLTADIDAGKSGGMSYTTDGGATWTQVLGEAGYQVLGATDFASVVGFGKASDGADYPAVYICGTVDGNEGVYRSDDKGVTWVKINDDAHQYGSNNYAITGDMREYGTVYYGANGRGIIMGFISETPNTHPDNTTTTTTTTTIENINLIGDVDIDGSAGKIADVVLLGKHVASKLTITGQSLINANCDTRDLAINVADLQALIKYMLKQINSLPFKG